MVLRRRTGTIVLSWGPYGGLYVHARPPRRICLGWVALTYSPIEFDSLMEGYVAQAEAEETESHWRDRYNAEHEEVEHLRTAIRTALKLRGSTDGYLLVNNLQARETLERGLYG